jgi:hypothetical protein
MMDLDVTLFNYLSSGIAMTFNEFCRSKECEYYIEWEYNHGHCVSCKLHGQSHNINEYPEDCIHLTEIKICEKEKEKKIMWKQLSD